MKERFIDVPALGAGVARLPVVLAAVETQFEVELLRDGGVLPHILLNATRDLNPQGEAA